MKNFKVVIFIFAILCFLQGTTYAQNQTYSCEVNTSQLNGISNFFLETRKNKEESIILIARLGKKEKNLQLNKRRLYAVKTYLIYLGINKNDVITASSENTNSLGVIEIYIGGRLSAEIEVNHNKDFPVGNCDNDIEDEKLFQLPKPKGNKLKI